MASGDAQRIWFPEMIERLRSQWHEGISFEAMIALRDEADSLLRRIRAEEQIASPFIRCRECGYAGRGAEPRVSVRSMILAAGRFGIVPAEQAHTAEKAWAAHRKQNGLDLYGGKAEEQANPLTSCGHPRTGERRRVR
jgi:hypothetical protein